MKKPVAWIVAWSLYWLGDGVSRVMHYWPWEAMHPYWLYNRLMLCSSDIQDWGGTHGPWLDAPPQEPDEHE